jgi:hypothetical protein
MQTKYKLHRSDGITLTVDSLELAETTIGYWSLSQSDITITVSVLVDSEYQPFKTLTVTTSDNPK